MEELKKRTFTLELTDDDVTRLANKAASAGMSMGELLASFVGDLVCGSHTNGSDERMLAQSWFDRCGFSYFPSNDVARLAQGLQLDDAIYYAAEYVATADDLEDAKNDPDCPADELEAIEETVADNQQAFSNIITMCKCEGSFDEVLAAVLAWNADTKKYLQ